jgi:hypothetical protein
MGQSWLFGKPVPADRLGDVMSMRPPVRLRSSSNVWRDISHSSPPGQRLSHLQALYDGAPVGLAFLSRDLRYISMNQQLAGDERCTRPRTSGPLRQRDDSGCLSAA